MLWKTSTIFALASILSACNTFFMPTEYKTQSRLNEVNVYCSGVEECSFNRVGNTIISDDNGWVTLQALSQGLVKLQTSSLLDERKVAFYLSIPAKEQEIDVSFYPVSKHRAEKFTMIHNFRTGHKYTLHMYRQQNSSNGSLFNVSAPEPLCINLLQDQIPIRKFCQEADILTGLGEFVEQDIS